MDADEEELEELKNETIPMYGHKAEIKKGTIRACRKMSAKQNEEVC